MEVVLSATFGHPAGKGPSDFLYHIHMVDIIVDVKEQLTREHLHENAPNRPHVALLVPLATFQQNLGAPILAGVDRRAMRFVTVSCTSEIDQFNAVARRNRVLLI
jgi:hypothetical protein